jgi:hypothetical protein
VIRLTIALGSTLLCLTAVGQETIGKVQLEDATVAGPLEVSGGTATVRGGASIVAKDHTAKLDLARGGTVKVCRTSSLRVTSGKSATGTEPLMLALNRGAIEVQMTAAPSDVVMTPDLRFSIRSAGPLDLRLRVTPNGDDLVDTGDPRQHGLSQGSRGAASLPGSRKCRTRTRSAGATSTAGHGSRTGNDRDELRRRSRLGRSFRTQGHHPFCIRIGAIGGYRDTADRIDSGEQHGGSGHRKGTGSSPASAALGR